MTLNSRTKAAQKLMIRVSKISSEARDERLRLHCDYEMDGKLGRLWYEIDEELSCYASADCGDAFFIALTLFAHINGQDVSFEASVSKRLYYGVTEILLPALRVISPQLPIVRVTADTKNFHFAPVASGTALSLGVDSFHALASSLNGPFPVTHLALFNSGAFGDLGGDESRALFLSTAERVEVAASQMGLPLIVIDSNISEVLQVPFIHTHSIRNLSFAFLLPGLFRVFYYASSYPVEKFRLHASLVGAASYDLLTSKALCTESCEVMIAGPHDERIDKMAMIAAFAPSLEHLNVCVLAESNQFLDRLGGVKNCSRCFKCVKTMVALDVIGALDLYEGVFDLDLYRSEQIRYRGWVLYGALKLRGTHELEILREGRKVPGFFTPATYWYAFQRGLRNLLRKLRPERSGVS